jgi:hypothetical protein
VRREVSESDVIGEFRAEVSGWSPRRVPNLLDLTQPPAHHWRQPVAVASALGSAMLAVLLVASILVVMFAPGNIPGMVYVKDHLATQPLP